MTQDNQAPDAVQLKQLVAHLSQLVPLVDRLAGMVERNTIGIRKNREAIAKITDLVERTVGLEPLSEHEVPNLQPRKKLHDVPTLTGTPLERDFTGTYIGRGYTPDHHEEAGEEPEEPKDH
jgi:hypothetical protein